MKNNGEFKGKTIEAIATLKEETREIKKRVDGIDRKIWILIVLTILSTFAVENEYIKTAIAFFK